MKKILSIVVLIVVGVITMTANIRVIQQDKMIRYVKDGDENINNATIMVEASASTISFTLDGNDKGLFALYNPLKAQKGSSLDVETQQGVAQVELHYLGNFSDALGKSVSIILNADGQSKPLTTTIEDMPTLTFLPAQSAYTVKHTNGTEVSYTIAQNASAPITTQVTEEGMLAVELSLTQTTYGEYAFVGWQEISQDENGNEIVKYISYDQNCVYKFNGSAQVRPEFIHYSVATFFIQSQADKKIAYHDFALAMKDAEQLYKSTKSEQVVIFESIYTIRDYSRPSSVTEANAKVGTLESGNYTIPAGVTLLIPGDAAYTCRVGDVLTNGEDYQSGSSFTNIRKLNLAEGTNIAIKDKGNLSVYAEMSYNQPYNGQPVTYGWIAMGKNTHIIAESGAVITCYGYITGNPDNSSVTIKNGAYIHESFQIKDWRGGAAALGMITITSDKVFPIQQYYVQNVETRLVLEYGAIERISTAANITGIGEVYPSANIVVPEGNSESSLFKLGEGASLVKYYDISTDRLKIIVLGNKSGNEKATASMDGIQLNISSYPINSADYVLPLNNNIDVSLYNVNVTVVNELAFLAGSSLCIDAKSMVLANDNVFVYDGDQHIVNIPNDIKKYGIAGSVVLSKGNYNYFYASNTYLCPLTKRPGDIQYKRDNYKGTQNGNGYYHNTDAKWVIDGVVEGSIYTTNGGANITSNGGGKIKVISGSNIKLKQAVQYVGLLGQTVAYGDIPQTLAKLKHNDGTYLSSANGNTYVYDAAQGKWILNGTSAPTIDNNDYTPNFTIDNLSKFSAYVGKSASAELNITPDNENVNWSSVAWSYQITGPSASQFSLNEGRTSITFSPTSAGIDKTATLKVVASYVNNQQLLYTATQEVVLTGNALANTNDLDFALSAIKTTDGAKTLFKGGNDTKITVTNAADLAGFVTITESGNNYTIAAKDGVNTTILVEATQDPTDNVNGATITKLIVVGSGKQPLEVPILVDEDNFEQVTWAKSSNVAFNNGLLMPEHSQWTAFFTGTPDKLKFTPTTTTTWQVEEYDGKGWNVLYDWATIAQDKEFALSLSPSASKVRIRSAQNGGTLKDVAITALTTIGVKANVDTLFIPVVKGENETISRSILLTYQSSELVRLSTSNISLLTLDATVLDPAVDEYKQQVVTLTSKVQEAGEYHVSIRVGSEEKLVIPVIVYEVPQELPIMLKNDIDKNRFYYVTSSSNYASWNASTREISLKNVVGSSAPSMTFAFTGAPTYISFNVENAKGEWFVEESVDGKSWSVATVATDKKTENNIEYSVGPTAQFIRVTYESLYAESVVMSNLMIIGEPGIVVDPLQMELTKGEPKSITITAINLESAPVITTSDGFEYTQSSVTGTIANNSVATIVGSVGYTGTVAITYGSLTITYGDKSVVVDLTGLAPELGYAETGIMTGVDPEKYTINGGFAYEYHNVNIANAYTKEGETVKTLFDFLVIYGETKPASGTEITVPTASAGSNAVTPCFIYKANDAGTAYELQKYVVNTNTSNKVLLDNSDAIAVDGTLEIYMTGFCPYASTGYTKAYEGVWYFQGNAGETLNIYLEDCHIYSRNKTEDGHPFQSKQDGNSFTESYVRGSGGVLVFECDDFTNTTNPFNVNIHTRGNNLLKSNHGCFFDILGYRAYQVSSPVQIHMKDENYVAGSRTDLKFIDTWPNTSNASGDSTRTNGYLALKKQVNNAPSIDMGNTNTVVNFSGGRVHLENAQIVSPNYQTTLAICYRSGKMGGIEFPFAHGIGTDDVGGTVNFNDGTTTVEPMEVDAKYRQYYLMDTDANGNELTSTSCLRTPTNTYVYGGSHCMMRACQHTTSKGGAPTDGKGNALGLYQYPRNPESGKKGGWTEVENGYGLVIPTYPPEGYKVKSVSPNNNDYLNFWVTADYDKDVTIEVDKNTQFWSACMTKIEASMNSIGGSVGGETYIDENTEVQNLLYCKIDDAIYDAITDPEYLAPVKIPSTTEYTRIPISVESIESEGQTSVLQNYITNKNNYAIQDKVYYVTTATADMWMTFTAPFDVANIYVVETYSENELSSLQATGNLKQREVVMKEQAKHNADFAAFYGVAMALYNKSSITFWEIFDDYMVWAKQQDARTQDENGNSIKQLYTGGSYDLRGKYALEHYNGSNYATAQYYLYENKANWTLSGEDDGTFTTQWDFPDVTDNILMNQGETYSLLFPYCTGCGTYIDEREFWDYWSGKFIIFESVSGQHTINGSNFVSVSDPNPDVDGDWVFEKLDNDGTYAKVTGNSTFDKMITRESELYTYKADEISNETFYRNVGWDDEEEVEFEKEATIVPTTAFLLATLQTNQQGMPARSISRTGKINYGKGNTPSGTQNGNVPTISGGSDIFVTEVASGINIAVATPQYVRVLSSAGALLYNGMVETSVDVNLPNNGIYVVAGENNSIKIMY